MSYNPVETYLQEADELLTEIEQSALSLDAGDRAGEIINQLFRAFHTIKGSAAMCGLDAVASFTHHVESLLDRVRTGDVSVTPELSRLVLKARDHIKTLLGVEHGGAVPADDSSRTLISAIHALSVSAVPAAPPVTGVSAQPATQHTGAVERTWRIRFRPNPTLLVQGGNPAVLFQELRALGRCDIVANTGEIPALDEIQPDLCYLWWTIELRSACDQNTIRDVFIFVEDESKLQIEPVEAAPSIAAADSGDGRLPNSPEPSQGGTASLPKAVAPPHKALARESTVRVPSNRLDHLVNLVGELVMNQSRLAQAASQSGTAELANGVQELERLVAELRDNILGIRMLPIGTLFGRFGRLVHDLSAELGKEADLVTEGSETELDKSILDQLGEPLVHCLRNCLDHAIEPPAERIGRGKPRRAVIRLSAVHTGSDVVVSIADDGRGIDRPAVRAKAIERQLISADDSLSDKEIFNLILMPGFSTARQVTNVSGRGVGMDVVKRQIDSLRGSLSLASEDGKGTRVSITLPLTLAIIEGLLVQIANDQFIIPMSVVTENVELLREQKARNNERNLIAVRGDLVPYIDLRKAFHGEGEGPVVEKVVIVQHEDHRVGLVVDRVLGTHQTVIQSLGKFFRNIHVVSGATILGDGRVALILDIAAVVRHEDRECREAAA